MSFLIIAILYHLQTFSTSPFLSDYYTGSQSHKNSYFIDYTFSIKNGIKIYYAAHLIHIYTNNTSAKKLKGKYKNMIYPETNLIQEIEHWIIISHDINETHLIAK